MSERDTERRTEGASKHERERERGGRRGRKRRGGRRKRIHPSVTLWQTARESQCEASLFSPSLFVLLSARPFVRLSACPSVRLFVCLLSLSPPAFRRFSHQKFISSPVLLQVLLLFLPCRRSRRLVIMYCFIARTLLKFDPVTRPGGSLSRARAYTPWRRCCRRMIRASPEYIRGDNRARVVLLIKDPSRKAS